MLIHRITRYGTDEIRLRVVGKREGLTQLVEVLGADWTLNVKLFWFVTLTDEDGVKDDQDYNGVILFAHM